MQNKQYNGSKWEAKARMAKIDMEEVGGKE